MNMKFFEKFSLVNGIKGIKGFSSRGRVLMVERGGGGEMNEGVIGWWSQVCDINCLIKPLPSRLTLLNFNPLPHSCTTPPSTFLANPPFPQPYLGTGRWLKTGECGKKKLGGGEELNLSGLGFGCKD